jgi:ABC-2 type transport system permease protein
VVGDGRVRVEFIDPISDPELEQQANRKYGIEPVPFRVADRHQAALVNSYFNVLVQYGDEYEVLGFRDLIELRSQHDGDLDVRLRNPEYDITRALKKVLLAYRSDGNLFDTVKGDLVFTAYVSVDEKLPQELRDFKGELMKTLDKVEADSDGRLKVEIIDPDANDGQVADQILKDFGFRPMAASLFDNSRFYFHLTLRKDHLVIQIPLGDFTADNFEMALESGIKRFASGFTRTVALVSPRVNPQMAQFGQGGPRFSQLERALGADLNVRREDLADGSIDNEADVLLLAAPSSLDETQLFAVDQFLMRGGTVIAATSPFSANLSRNRLSLARHDSGLVEWLQHHGFKIEEQLVMDPQNSAFPLPVTRQVGALRFQEMRMIDYPYFTDLRGEGLNQDNPMTRGLNQLSMAWASPIKVDSDKNAAREITELLHSSDKSWLSASLDIMPKIDAGGSNIAYRPSGEQGRHLLGSIAQGRFDSFFAGKDSPLLNRDDETKTKDDEQAEAQESVISGVIEHSPESARIILFASNDFLNDQAMQLAGGISGTEYLGGVQLIANAVDWSLEDQSLLDIRTRGHFSRTLPPMGQDDRLLWEAGNYLLAIAILLGVAAIQHYYRRKKAKRYFVELTV